MFTMRVTPKISDSPAARKNSDEAFARPFRAWIRNTSIDRLLLLRPQPPHFAVRRQDRSAVDIAEIDHGALAALHRGLADPGAHGALVVDRAVLHRAGGRVELQAAERADQLLGVGAAGLGDAGGERLHGDIADDRSEARIVVEALLVGRHELLVRRRVDL